MYGTIARFQLKPGAEKQIEKLMTEFREAQVPGFVTEYIYRSDSDPNSCWMAVVFNSKASYQANANSPEQNTRYQAMRALLESDPEWHDGEVIYVLEAKSLTHK